MSSEIIQIVPLRGKAPEGVGDYARLIAERLLRNHGSRTIFVSGSPLPREKRLDDNWKTHEVSIRRADTLFDSLMACGSNLPILLHLSPYGYHPRGMPFWLLSGLARWRRLNPATPMVTVFHELYATSTIWRSPFWIGWLQRLVVRKIQRISTAGTTTTEPYARLLANWNTVPACQIATLPVFSTIGESDSILPTSARRRSMVVFGRQVTAYGDHPQLMEAFVTAHGITEVIDLGRRDTAPPAHIGTAPVRVLGMVSAAAVRHELARATFGLLEYDADRLAKSTIFAAYCEAGAIPVCISTAAGLNDGLLPGVNYLKLEDSKTERLSAMALDELQKEAIGWYRPHSLEGSTLLLARMLGLPSAVREHR